MLHSFYDELASINHAQDVAMKNDTLEKVKEATQSSKEMKQLAKVIQQGWPETKEAFPRTAGNLTRIEKS